MKKVYVSGPYTLGDTLVNVNIAVEAANRLLEHNFTPFVPHLSHFWDKLYPHNYEIWIDWCLEWVAVCDCILRIPGMSPGADREVELAQSIGIPVYHSIHDLLQMEK